jgi:hypothetical protein
MFNFVPQKRLGRFVRTVSTFKNLYHQIFLSIIGQHSDVLGFLPDLRQENGNYFITEDIFPAGIPVERIRDDEVIGEEFNKVDLFPQSFLLLLPPLETRKDWPLETKEKYPRLETSESVILSSFARKLKSGSHIIALVPEGFLTSTSKKMAREEIFTIAQPVLIVSHDLAWEEFGIPIHPALRFSTIVMVKANDANLPVRFFKLEKPKDSTHTKTILNDFQRLMKQGGGQTKYGYVIRGREQIRDHWRYDFHHPNTTKRKQELSVFGVTRSLSDLFEVRAGPIRRGYNGETLIENISGELPKGIPLIEGRDLQSDGSLFLDTRYSVSNPNPIALLRPGDILIRSIHSFNNSTKFPVVEVMDNMSLTASSNSVLVLRPIVPLSLAEKAFILAYLRSDTFLNFLQIESSSVHILPAALKEIPIPVPDSDMLTAISGLSDAITQFQGWISEAERAKDFVFKTQSITEARLQTLSAGRRARQRLEAGYLVEDYNHRIRTQFPHPLAFLWRTTEASKEDLNGYSQILVAAENALCYLACMSIVAISSSYGTRIKGLESIATNLCDTSHGTSMGHWIAILRETNSSKTYRTLEKTAPFYEVVRAFLDANVDEVIQRLKKKRDALAHGRGPQNTRDLLQEFKEAKSDLDTLYKSMDFLTDYPLRYVENTSRDSILKKTLYSFRELRGDHPLVPLAQDVSTDPELEAGSLYLVDRQKKLHLLRPLLIRKECPECGTWATFYLDQFDAASNTPILKSMEHGHTLSSPELLDPFKQVGLLK